MRHDIAARASPAVAVEDMAQLVDAFHQRPANSELSSRLEILREELQYGGEVRCRPFAVHIAFGKADIPAGQRPFGKSELVHVYHRVRAGIAMVEQHRPPIRQIEPERSVLSAQQEQTCEAKAGWNPGQLPQRGHCRSRFIQLFAHPWVSLIVRPDGAAIDTVCSF